MDAIPFTMYVTIPLKPECVGEYLKLANDVMRFEPTFVNPVLSRSTDDPSLFMIHETWLDRENFLAVQMNMQYRRRYEERLPHLLRGGREMKVCELIRSDFVFMSGAPRSP